MYYDACALTSKGVSLMSSESNKCRVLTSHLAIGEAVSSTLHKHGIEPAKALLEMIETMVGKKVLKIVGNDGTRKFIENIHHQEIRLSETDSMHLATAIKHRCDQLKTFDPHFHGLRSGDLHALCEKLDFCVAIVNPSYEIE